MGAVSTYGQIDVLDRTLVHGWAVEWEDRSAAGAIDVLIDGTLVATFVADTFRDDLAAASIRSGFAGFTFEIAEAYRDGKPHVIDFRHQGTEHSLTASPRTFCIEKPAVPAAQRRETCALSRFVLRDDTQCDAFSEHLARARKVAIVSTFHDAGRFFAYHEAMFRNLSESGFLTIVVHASGKIGTQVAAPAIANCYTIVKRNIGYDFGSWAVAMYRLRPLVEMIDELVLINDSVVPVQDGALGSLIARARASGADVVGLTDSYEHIYHLQSYFLWMGAAAARSAALRDFMAGYSFSSVKAVVIEEGELALTKRLLDAGLSVAALYEYDEVASLWLGNIGRLLEEVEALPAPTDRATGEDYRGAIVRQIDAVTAQLIGGRPMNATHFFWDTLIEACGFPLLKRELVLTNPCNVPTYFRIGRVLHQREQARQAIKEIRRLYGGSLFPTFAPEPSETALLRPPPFRLSSVTRSGLAVVE